MLKILRMDLLCDESIVRGDVIVVAGGDLPFIGVEIGGNRFGGEKCSAATGALRELLKPRFAERSR